MRTFSRNSFSKSEILVKGILTLLAVCLFAESALAQNSRRGRESYTLEFTNVTSQLLTTPVCAVHTRKAELPKPGDTASSGLAAMAEDGVVSELARELEAISGVRSVIRGGFVSPGDSESISFSANRRHRVTCFFGMLVVTNDAFPWLRNGRLPGRKRASRRFRAQVYDAGSEVNTESCDDVPGGPCDAHFVGVKENGVISRHEGIQGIADVSASRFGWTGPGVRGVIRRVRR